MREIKKEPLYLNKSLHELLLQIEYNHLLNRHDIALIAEPEGRGGDNLESIFKYLFEYNHKETEGLSVLVTNINYILRFRPQTNIDLICNRIKELKDSDCKNKTHYLGSSYMQESFMRNHKNDINFLESYSDKKAIDLLLSNSRFQISRHQLHNTNSNYLELIKNGINKRNFLLKKPKHIIDICKKIASNYQKIAQENFPLTQENISFLNNYKIGKYTISLPNDAHHLIDIGRKLNIFIGNSHYANKIKKQKCNVLLLKTDNNIVGCVELIEDKVIQSKGTNNLNIEFDLPLDVKKTILSYKQD
jgi:hypothetical protein